MSTSFLTRSGSADAAEVVELKLPWIVPTVQVISAGEAEVGTLNQSDGHFETS